MVRQIRTSSVDLIRSLYGIGALKLILAVLFGAEANAADYFNGKEVYDRHCQICHGVGGQNAVPGTPDFSRGEALLQSDSDLYRVIGQGKSAMPAYRGILSEDEARDVIAYLRSLQR